MQSSETPSNDTTQHTLRKPLTDALQRRLAETTDPHLLTETVLTTLGDFGVIAYAPEHTVRLLNPIGRALVALMERPDLTMRELGAYLGITESNAAKSVRALVENNLLTRTKVNGRTQYRLNLSEAMYHADIRRFRAAVSDRLSNLE